MRSGFGVGFGAGFPASVEPEILLGSLADGGLEKVDVCLGESLDFALAVGFGVGVEGGLAPARLSAVREAVQAADGGTGS